MNKMKVYVLRMRNANTLFPICIVKKSKENLQKFKEDAEKDIRYITYEIEEKEAKSITLDNTVYATDILTPTGLRETWHANKENLTYNDFIKAELGLK